MPKSLLPQHENAKEAKGGSRRSSFPPTVRGTRSPGILRQTAKYKNRSHFSSRSRPRKRTLTPGLHVRGARIRSLWENRVLRHWREVWGRRTGARTTEVCRSASRFRRTVRFGAGARLDARRSRSFTTVSRSRQARMIGGACQRDSLSPVNRTRYGCVDNTVAITGDCNFQNRGEDSVGASGSLTRNRGLNIPQTNWESCP